MLIVLRGRIACHLCGTRCEYVHVSSAMPVQGMDGPAPATRNAAYLTPLMLNATTEAIIRRLA